MQTSYSAEHPGLDEPAYTALRDDGVTIRVQPDLLQASGKYHGWRGVAWRVRCETPEEAVAVREALRLVFLALAERGPEAVSQAVQTLRVGQGVPSLTPRQSGLVGAESGGA